MTPIVNDGTGPLYDRPARITRDSRRRPAEPVEPEYPEWDAYQALLAEGYADEDARLAIWPDNALAYTEDEDGNNVLLPVGKDGLSTLSDEQIGDADEPVDDPETETPAGEAVSDADGPEAPPASDEPEIEAETGAESDPEEVAEVEAAAVEIEDGAEPEPEDEPAGDEGYDPASGTVDEVRAYLADNPTQTEYVLNRERAGKARVSLIGA